MNTADAEPWKVDRREFPSSAALRERIRFLLRYAVLAPSSHNTQPWKFAIGENRVDVFADETCWLRVADADRRELFLSTGCALENLLIAAEHFGLGHAVSYQPDSANERHAATVTFTENGRAAAYRPAELFEALTVRHTNHGRYDDRPIPRKTLEEFQSLCVEDGLALYLTDDRETRRQVDDLVVRADAIEFADPAFRRELAYWIGRGVFGSSWLMSKLGQLAVTHINMGKSQGKMNSELLMSSPVLGLIAVQTDDRVSQLQAGQLYERVSLLAASRSIWTQPMSQILQVPELKDDVAQLLPEPNRTPLHPFRMGYAEPERHTPRRPLAEVIVL